MTLPPPLPELSAAGFSLAGVFTGHAALQCDAVATVAKCSAMACYFG
jgi:esterase/lipase